jgi:hypothetical protein
LWDSHEFAGVQVFRMRTGITVHLNPIDRKRLQVIVDDRNSPQKHVWRARIVLASSIFRPRSTASSSIITGSQSPSSGPPILTKSSPPPRAATKC